MKSQLLFFLKNLDKKEQKRFFEYVKSPFFNKNKKLLRLISFYQDFAPTFTSQNLNAIQAFNAVYHEIPFDELKLNNLNSDLLQLLYDFLAYQEYESTPTQKTYYTGKALLKRDLSSKMKSTFKRYDRLQQQNNHQNSIALLANIQYHQLRDEWTISDGKRGYSESLVKIKEQLDQYYLIKQLEIACDMVSRNAAIQANYNTTFIDKLIVQLESKNSNWDNSPAIVIYYTTLKVLTGKDPEKNYFKLKELLKKHPKIFPKEELRLLYNFALNFCIKQINSGYGNYYEEVLTLYKALLSHRIIYKNGYLSQWTFTNICTAGVRLKQYDWTQQFIEQYQADLLPNSRMNVVNYNIAALYYAQKNWDQALQLLQTVIFSDAYYQTAAKTIQLKIYYESDESETFRSLIDSFAKFILRNKQLSGYQKKSNKNFISLTNKLFKLREDRFRISTPAFQEKVNQLLNKVKEAHPISNKNWILQQGAVLKTKR